MDKTAETQDGNRLQNYAIYYILTNKYGCKVTTFATHKEAASNNKSYIVQAKEEVIKILCGIIPSVAEKRFGNDITRWANFTSWNKKIPTRHYYGTEELPNKLMMSLIYFLRVAIKFGIIILLLENFMITF